MTQNLKPRTYRQGPPPIKMPATLSERNFEITRAVANGAKLKEVGRLYDLTSERIKQIVRRYAERDLELKWINQRAAQGRPSGLQLMRPRILQALIERRARRETGQD